MSNFGFFHLRVVNPYEVAYAEARSAVNASAVLAQSQQYGTVAEAIADCELVVGTTSVGPTGAGAFAPAAGDGRAFDQANGRTYRAALRLGKIRLIQ